ncbi:flagellar protein FlgN [Methyloraptor flagellatus]|uniref:Flagellar protein FlgN n=1 Tax=Methyloraptor flagellatus TaxID=3162530 RepID=A0AAU7XB83_9HYPH
MMRPPPAQNPADVAVQTSEEAEVLLAELERSMDALIAVIDRETALVRDGLLFAAGDLEKEKSDFAAAYLKLRGRLKASAEVIGSLAPASAERLRQRHEEFAALLRINLAVLATAREVAETIVRNVSTAVGKRTAPPVYGRNAAPAAPRLGGARGIAYDRSL